MVQEYPSIVPLLYEEHDFLELYKLYIGRLREAGKNNVFCTAAANKLEQCFNISTDSTRLHELEEIFVELKAAICTWQKKNNFEISIFKRRKNLIGTIEKIFLCQQKGSLSEVNDVLGFRILIINGKEDTEDSIKAVYEICELIYEFFTKKKWFCPYSFKKIPTKNLSEIDDKHIIIPKESSIPDELLGLNFIKDYVAFPKKNGYQSIHMVFIANDGTPFEIQIRTQAMHIHAEYGRANHEEYKENRYNKTDSENPYLIVFDPLKVRIKGYVAFMGPDGHIIVNDPVGLNTSIDPFNFLLKKEDIVEDLI